MTRGGKRGKLKQRVSPSSHRAWKSGRPRRIPTFPQRRRRLLHRHNFQTTPAARARPGAADQSGPGEVATVGMGATRVCPAGWEADEKRSESNRRKRGHTRQSGDLESGAKAHRPKPRVSEPLTPTEAITTLNRDSWAVTFHLKSFNWVVT